MRCLSTLSRRVVCGSPGSARAISGRGTGLNPRPESMPSAAANHGGKLRRAAVACGRSLRQERLRCAVGEAKARGRGSSGAGWLSVPMRIGGGGGGGGAFGQLKGPLAGEEPQETKIRY